MQEPEKIKIVIADDHTVFRDGLRFLIQREKNMEIVGEAATGRDLLLCVEQQQPRLIITDLVMPLLSGLEAIREIVVRFPTVRIIALSSFDHEQLIIEALKMGAQGYIIKNAPKGEIIHAIRTVLQGLPYYCMSTTPDLARKISDSDFYPYKNKPGVELTEAEKRIILFLCEERKNEEIAKLIGMSIRTLERMRLQIQEKIGVRSLAGLVIFAVKQGIYRIPS